ELAIGTFRVALVGDITVTSDVSTCVLLNSNRVFSTDWKLVPVTVITCPVSSIVGVKLVIVGASDPVVTVNGVALVALPFVVELAIGPDAAPVGTTNVIVLAVAVDTVAACPLSVTVSSAGFVLKPVPVTVMTVPTGPRVGKNSTIDVCADNCLSIDVRF